MPEHGAVPTLVSLLLCDQIIDDRLSNKKSAIGMFNTVFVASFPASIHNMSVMASVTEIAGRVELELRLVRDADLQVIFAGKGLVEAPNPLAVVDLIFHLQGIQIAAAGQYAFEVLAAGELLGRRRFQVVQMPRRGQPEAPPEPN